MVEIDNEGRKKTIHFGSKGADDYTITKNIEQRERYIARHQARENWTDPLSAGFYAKHILWGPTTSIRENLEIMKKKFNL